MGRNVYLVSSALSLSLILSGCGVASLNSSASKEDEIKEYNILVEDTLSSYASARVFSDKNQQGMLGFVTRDREWSLADDVTDADWKPLSKSERVSFKDYSIIYDDHLTSLGSDTATQSLLVSGRGYTMLVSVTWDKHGVRWVKREVKKK